MLNALVAGTRDPEVLAELAKGQLRKKLPPLQEALTGRFGVRHTVVVSEILAHLDYLDETIERLSGAIDEAIAPFADARDRLATIPGVNTRLAEAIIGEIGVDMTRFPTTSHLASWAGMCPGHHELAGKSRKGTARRADNWLQRHLTLAARPTQGTYLSSQYHRLAMRRGKRRARKAVGHSILVAAWHILSAVGVTYQDLGPDWFDRRNDPLRRARRKMAELSTLGCIVQPNADGTTTVTLPAA